MTKTVKFYFDAISPYAWLAWRPLQALVTKHNVQLDIVPVLFAGLLNANGQLGPAEIPNKRLWLMTDVMRRAHSQALQVKFPPKHPFNPLLSLRVASLDMSTKEKQDFTCRLLDAVWMEGKDVSDPLVVSSLADSVGLNGAECVHRATTDQVCKQRLHRQTDEAIAAGVFGVPSFIVDGELFWGSERETMGHIEAAVLGQSVLDKQLLEQWKHLEVGSARKR